MTGKKELRTERIQIRITKEIKETIKQAAALKGVSVSSFIVSSELEQANRNCKDLMDRPRLELSARDSLALAEALLNPPGPNKALRELMRRRAKLVENGT